MTTNTRAGVCWRIVLPTGEDWDPGDGTPHFDTEQAAMDERLGEEPGVFPPGVKATQFDAPCVTISCDECGADPGGGDVFAEVHYPDMETARKLARESDWTITPDGKTYCWDCPTTVEDDEDED